MPASVGFHIQAMQAVGSIADIAANTGTWADHLVAPGGAHSYTVFAEREGAFVVHRDPRSRAVCVSRMEWAGGAPGSSATHQRGRGRRRFDHDAANSPPRAGRPPVAGRRGAPAKAARRAGNRYSVGVSSARRFPNCGGVSLQITGTPPPEWGGHLSA